MIFLPTLTKELLLSLDFYLEREALEGGFCYQLSFILKSPFKKKFISKLYNRKKLNSAFKLKNIKLII